MRHSRRIAGKPSFHPEIPDPELFRLKAAQRDSGPLGDRQNVRLPLRRSPADGQDDFID